MALGRLWRPLHILTICFAAAFGCAFVFAAMLQFSLPPTDAAYGKGSGIFSDPFVLGGLIIWASIAALISFPIAWYCLKRRKLLKCSVFVVGIVLAEIMIVTPFWGWRGFLGSFPALIAALLFCKFTKSRRFAEHSTEQA